MEMGKRNNSLFILITFVIILQGISIIKKLIKPGTEQWYTTPDMPIYVFIIIVAAFVVLTVVYKDKLIFRNSFIFLFMTYCLDYLAKFIWESSIIQSVLYILALSLLPLSFIYAFKYWRTKIKYNGSKSQQQYNWQIFIIIVTIVLIFIWYGRP